MATPLSQALAAGDREAFAALYDRLGVRLYRTALTMLSSTTEAEDVVHDLFVELARVLLASLAAVDPPAVTRPAPRAAAPVAPERPTFRPLDVRRLLEENP